MRGWHHRHHHHHHHGPLPKRLRRRILFGFGGAILLSVMTAVIIGRVMYDGEWGESRRRMESFASDELARVWDDPVARDGLVGRLSETFQVRMTLTDTQGGIIVSRGENCTSHAWKLAIARDGHPLGQAEVCAPKHPASGAPFALPFIVACLALWGAAGVIARRLTRPLDQLVRVTQEIGAGKYDARAPIDCRTPDEVSLLGESINDMAARIERQIKEQKMLLAAVSHELRTPLGHLRILTEIAREKGSTDAKTLDDMESEIKEVDDLVGELLARSRLDFSSLTERPLEASELAARAIERAGLSADRLQVVSGPHAIRGDPTLILRALANLIDNAIRHGGGLERLVVKNSDGVVAFAAEDRGPGIPKGEEMRVFEAFYRRDESGTLGLGLALVDRIARAHKGRATAENRPDGGARVALVVPAV